MRGTWVGPTKCDSERDRRTWTLDSIWKSLHTDVSLHLDLGTAVDLFREATSCYQNGAFLATALMCRASTETAVYLSISRKRSGLSIEMNLDSIHNNWKRILRKAKRKGFVDTEMEGILKHVRKKGNFAAHYAQKFDQNIVRNQGLGRLWITRIQARELLRQSARFLDLLKHNMNSKSETLGQS